MKIIKGNLLNCKEDIILHQVNLQGFMGGGLAYQIACNYPDVEKEYEQFKNKKLGEVCFAKTKGYVVGNCFSQTWDFNTDYKALEQCLDKVNAYLRENDLKTVAIPYGYGCGIANGNWEKVLEIFERKIKNLNIYKL